MRRPYLVGNWKLNRTVPEAVELAGALRAAVDGYEAADVAVCPTFVAISAVAEALKGSSIAVGGQDLYWEESGAFTGEVSGPMLQAAGAALAIVGHSERRALFGETDEIVARKLAAGLRCGLNVILCVGETLEEREKSATFDVISRQARAAFAAVESDQTDRLTIAYEPVWAIGTGRNATPEQAEEVHAFIRSLIVECFSAEAAERTRIQYGGSVKPSNVKELMACPNVDGALVGGASLKAEDFSQIVKFAEL